MPLDAGTGQSKQFKTRSKQAARGQDAIKLLKTDHDDVADLFGQYEKVKNRDESKKADLIDQICTALSSHAQIEEEIFYPAARNALEEDGEELLDEAERTLQRDGQGPERVCGASRKGRGRQNLSKAEEDRSGFGCAGRGTLGAQGRADGREIKFRGLEEVFIALQYS